MLKVVQGSAAGLLVRVVARHQFLESLSQQARHRFFSLDSQVLYFSEQPPGESESDVLRLRCSGFFVFLICHVNQCSTPSRARE
jgi:hypothetical protein